MFAPQAEPPRRTDMTTTTGYHAGDRSYGRPGSVTHTAYLLRERKAAAYRAAAERELANDLAAARKANR